MIIAVDIGNSDVVLGLVKDSKILQSWRMHTVIHQSVDEYEILVRGMLFACDFSLNETQGSVLSSVVPELTEVFFKLLNKNSLVRIPNSSNNAKHVFHQYTIKTEKRDKLIKILEDNKIGHAIYYPIPLNKQKIYKNLYGQSSFPTAEKVSQNCISLPMFPELSIDEIKYISNIINKEV